MPKNDINDKGKNTALELDPAMFIKINIIANSPKPTLPLKNVCD